MQAVDFAAWSSCPRFYGTRPRVRAEQPVARKKRAIGDFGPALRVCAPNDHVDDAPVWIWWSCGTCNRSPGGQRHFRCRNLGDFVDQNDRKHSNKTINLSCLADINLDVFWWLHGHQALSSGPTSHPTDRTQSCLPLCHAHTKLRLPKPEIGGEYGQ